MCEAPCSLAGTAVAITLPASNAVIPGGGRRTHHRNCKRLPVRGIHWGGSFTGDAPAFGNTCALPVQRTCDLPVADVADLGFASARAVKNVVCGGHTGRLPRSCRRPDDAADTGLDPRGDREAGSKILGQPWRQRSFLAAVGFHRCRRT